MGILELVHHTLETVVSKGGNLTVKEWNDLYYCLELVQRSVGETGEATCFQTTENRRTGTI